MKPYYLPKIREEIDIEVEGEKLGQISVYSCYDDGIWFDLDHVLEVGEISYDHKDAYFFPFKRVYLQEDTKFGFWMGNLGEVRERCRELKIDQVKLNEKMRLVVKEKLGTIYNDFLEAWKNKDN